MIIPYWFHRSVDRWVIVKHLNNLAAGWLEPRQKTPAREKPRITI
jgi:hypothetical protein